RTVFHHASRHRRHRSRPASGLQPGDPGVARRNRLQQRTRARYEIDYPHADDCKRSGDTCRHLRDEFENGAFDAMTMTDPWTVIVVDDEPDVREITKIVLHDLEFDDRSVDIIEAGSAREAREILTRRSDVALMI